MQWLKDLLQAIIDAIAAAFHGLLELLKDAVYWLFDLFMTVIDSLIGTAIAAFEPIDITQYMTGFPPEAAWVLGQVGVPQALIMIASGISIRLMLQLVPFTRLGS